MAQTRRSRLSPAYARRNARARAAGYRSYYDYRIHDNGRIPPGEPAPAGEARRRLRGHAGPADFLRSIEPGTLVILASPIGGVRRSASGVYLRIDKLTVSPDGKTTRSWTLRNLTRAQLVRLIRDEEAAGAVFSPTPSLDQRRLLSADELA